MAAAAAPASSSAVGAGVGGVYGRCRHPRASSASLPCLPHRWPAKSGGRGNAGASECVCRRLPSGRVCRCRQPLLADRHARGASPGACWRASQPALRSWAARSPRPAPGPTPTSGAAGRCLPTCAALTPWPSYACATLTGRRCCVARAAGHHFRPHPFFPLPAHTALDEQAFNWTHSDPPDSV